MFDIMRFRNKNSCVMVSQYNLKLTFLPNVIFGLIKFHIKMVSLLGQLCISLWQNCSIHSCVLSLDESEQCYDKVIFQWNNDT